MFTLSIIVLLLILALLSFFFSLSETALIALSKIRLHRMVTQKKRNAEKVERLLRKSEKLITTILIGNNFVNIAISSLATALTVYFFGQKIGILIATLCTALFILVICEITPKLLAIQHSEKVSLLVAPVMELIVGVSEPVILVFTKTSNFIIRIFGGEPRPRSPLITEEELRLMIEVGREEGVLSDQERKMLHRIFEFGDIKVSSVMVPKEDIVGVNRDATQEELLRILAEEGHSRIAVYQDSIDNIVGILYVHDLLYMLRNGSLFMLEDLIHPAYYVSAHMRVSELLAEFQRKKIQIAIVIDDNKKTCGLVTLEDLVEEIVGDIAEESVDTW